VIALIGCYALRTMLLQAGFQRGNQLAADRVELGQHPKVPLGRNGAPAARFACPSPATRSTNTTSSSRGDFSGLLVGSVSQQSAQHSPCPVVIVRGAATRP
jgi:universal stress protein family protein